MKHSAFTTRPSARAVAVSLALIGAFAHAQTIERVRMTDNDLNCQRSPNPKQQAVAQQQAAMQSQQAALMAQQAQGRKEHLTTLFLSKGCKLGDMQK